MSKVKIMSMVITARDGKMSNFPLNISIGFILVVYNRWWGYIYVLYNLNLKMKS
jgi:hypothetical protein